MPKDEIVEEVRRTREAYAARFNEDLDAIYKDLKNKERKSKRKFVAFAPKELLLPASPNMSKPVDV